ncbi:hypothetical protein CERSUDRAFT_45768 [Gelatoporia subvermispora B]|uniref:BAH domain-containing protein n=1 Tax=Ceriporiopsis subvermispora (strain B) TaxID=914234 RepID=M2R637_CERS8|nr:hypothetical protein CERSUDRAFT_45768 [Gelatoporia subvermispora B]
MPRLRLSTDHVKFIIWILKQLGVTNVPNFKTFRHKQAQLNRAMPIQTQLKRSPRGPVFYQNNIRDLLALDWANPECRASLEEYPVRSAITSESCHSQKWTRDIPAHIQAPMWANGRQHFFLGELTQLDNLQLVVPLAWYRKETHGNVFFEAYEVAWTGNVPQCTSTSRLEYPCSRLFANVYELTDYGVHLSDHGTCGSSANPLRVESQGRRMYSSFVKIWVDDVSGNRSKQYNEHSNVYFAHANLPHQKLSQEYFIHFVSTSNHASPGDQLNAVVQDVQSPRWTQAFDCEIQEEILIQTVPLFEPADNPQQSDTCLHMGLKGNLWCRRCKLGGPERLRETDAVYEQHFAPAELRKAPETLAMVKAQLDQAARGVAKSVQELQTQSGVKDRLAEYWVEQLLTRAQGEHQRRIYNVNTRDERLKARKVTNRVALVESIKQEIHDEVMAWLYTQPSHTYDALPVDSPLRTQLRPGDHFNMLLQLDGTFGDMHDDTPVEILHTYLLGMAKYAWHYTNTPWTLKQCELFAIRLQSASIVGLSIPPLRAGYMLQYRNGLIGKHFKALQQLAIFQLDESLCDRRVIDLWNATGELGSYLWYHEIENMDHYVRDVEVLIANLLDIWSLLDPRRVFVKPKLHILTHIVEDIWRHGPAGLYATEIFECFNAVFRLCSVLSNHQAPSRDIAVAVAGLTRFKYQVSGAWWRDEGGDYVHAGIRVREYFDNAQLQRRLGFTVAGTVKPKPRSTAVSWRSLAIDTEEVDTVRGMKKWLACTSVIAEQGESCPVGAWVFVDHEGGTRFGRIKLILRPESAAESSPCVVLERFTIWDDRHAFFQMPQVVRSEGAKHFVVDSQDVLFMANVQHNCHDGKCKTTGTRRRRQERIETDITEVFVEHRDDDSFIINMHALHNGALLRKILPRTLTEPRPYIQDRVTAHKEMAAKLRASQETKRAKEAKARKDRDTARAAEKAAAQQAPGVENTDVEVLVDVPAM